eukprot:scaffold53882_cov39-Cyclotella_meneghiniana.AAC.1
MVLTLARDARHVFLCVVINCCGSKRCGSVQQQRGVMQGNVYRHEGDDNGNKGLHGRDFECWEAAGLSQCLIVDMLNDVMWSGLECFASKGLHGLDIEFREAAGLPQCLIVDMLNDVMWSGLECFARKSLHGLDFE